MYYTFPPDVQQLIANQMASGRYANEDDVLRDALRISEGIDGDAAAVQAAIDEWKSGDEGVALDQAFDVVREEFHRKLLE